MTMKKTDVVDMTIRASAPGTKQAVIPPDNSIDAPYSSGNLGNSVSTFNDSNRPYDHNQVSAEGTKPDSSQVQPSCPAPAESNLHDGTGSKVSFPQAADGTSAGSVGTGHGLAGTQITGSKVSFPPASDNSAMPKEVSSWK